MNWYTVISNNWSETKLGYPTSDWTDKLDSDRTFLLNIINSFGEEIKQLDILDCCCGNGRHANYLAELGASITGLDLSPYLLADAVNHSESRNIKFICDDYRNFYTEKQFDFVYFMHDISLITYNYSPKEIIRNFNHIRNITKMFGYVLFGENRYSTYPTDQNVKLPDIHFEDYTYKEKFSYSVFSKTIDRKMKLVFKNGVILSNSLKHNIYTIKEFSNLFQELGFKILRIFNDYNFNNSFDPKSPGIIFLLRKEDKGHAT